MIHINEISNFFGINPKTIDQEVAIYEYKLPSAHNVCIDFFISICEGFLVLTLSHSSLEIPLFELAFHQVFSIECSDYKMIINQEKATQPITLQIKPSYSLVFEW